LVVEKQQSAVARPTRTPEPPYHIVVFTSLRPRRDEDDGYDLTAQRLEELVQDQPGYLGMDSVRGPDGLGITVAYWMDEESITAWRQQAEHVEARRSGRDRWYESFAVHVARVDRAYRFDR
jgi:heme-degrading monooxygenase HmoA